MEEFKGHPHKIIQVGLRPIGIRLSTSFILRKLIEIGCGISNGDVGDRLASLASDWR